MSESIISHAQARTIAADWHGGQTSLLYSLCSAGYLGDDASYLLWEINDNIASVRATPSNVDNPTGEINRLLALRKYVDYRITHGQIHGGDGWSSGWDDTLPLPAQINNS